MVSARVALVRESRKLERMVLAIARGCVRTRLLMTAPGVGAIRAYLRRGDRRSDALQVLDGVGAHFGLTSRKYRSGETDITGGSAKWAMPRCLGARGAEAAHIILTRPVKGSALKSGAWRAGMKKAKVALAHKLAVIRHRMWIDGTNFAFTAPEPLTPRRR